MTVVGALALGLALHVSSASAFVAPSAVSSNAASAARSGALHMSTSTEQQQFTLLKGGDDAPMEVVEPKGSYASWLSIGALKQAGEWSSSPGTYFQARQEEADGEPVYKMHPGIKSIAVTDHVSGEWFFNQPDSVLDRQHGPMFGPLVCREEYIGKTMPALVTNLEELHPDIRGFTIAVLKERLGSVQSAWSHSSDKFYSNLWEKGLGEYPTVYDTFLQQAYAFMLEWVLGTGEEGGQPLPLFKSFLNVNPSSVGVLLKLKTDGFVSNAAIKLLGANEKITDEQLADVEILLDSIRSSPMFGKFSQMLEDSKIPLEDLERSFMFNTGFQSSSAIAKQMEYAVGTLTAHSDFLADIRKELDGKDLTVANVDNAQTFPLLDSFFWEILRMFPAPPFFFKHAKKDLLMPAGNGKLYKIKEGETLCAHAPLIHIDTAAFGPDAREFNPRRFLGQTALKKKVFGYAFADMDNPDPGRDKPWGCAAHTAGMLNQALKLFYGRWIQEAEWTLKDAPVVDPVQYLGIVGPKNMTFTSVSPRKAPQN